MRTSEECTGPEGPRPDAVGNHLALTVDQLPTDENPSGIWYVDSGLGDAGRITGRA